VQSNSHARARAGHGTCRRCVRTLALAAAITLLITSGCKKEDDIRQDESVKVVVATDRKLAEEEAKLLASRGSLQRSRSTVRDKRADLLTRKLALGDDDTDSRTRAQLEEEESELVHLEARLAKQEIALNKKLDSLFEQKSGLVAKLGKGTEQTKTYLLARREHSIAQRERSLGRREAELGAREKVLAGREHALAVRQAKICPGRSTVVHVPSARPRTEKAYTRKDVEPVYRNALATMRKKGILIADLPPGIDRLVTDTRHAVSRGDYSKAKYSVDQLLAAVRAIRIDRGFIGTKIAKLSKIIRRSPLKGSKKAQAQQLFRQATTAYGDGRFSAANKKLNRIYALLR
jgi:hypothetical protein